MTRRLLVVDDEVSVRSLLSRILVRQGFDVQVATSGEEACSLSIQAKPDLVILDLNLPDLSGEEVCQRIRHHPATQHIPVLILTGKTMEGLCTRCLNEGADAYLSKPFDNEEILAHVRALLRRSQQWMPEDEIISYGGLTIRVSERMVLWKGTRIETLAPKEFGMLRLLVSRAPKVVDKDSLALNAWGVPLQELHQRTLDVHVRRLRKKLGPTAAACLKTIPSIGFQWFDQSVHSDLLSASTH